MDSAGTLQHKVLVARQDGVRARGLHYKVTSVTFNIPVGRAQSALSMYPLVCSVGLWAVAIMAACSVAKAQEPSSPPAPAPAPAPPEVESILATPEKLPLDTLIDPKISS